MSFLSRQDLELIKAANANLNFSVKVKKPEIMKISKVGKKIIKK